MKLNKKTVGAIIFVLLVLLLFFSRTIYTYNMPTVTGVRPSRGSLNKLEISSGIASWAEKENVYAVSSGIAGRVYVREGDRVEKDQILFEMEYNVAETNRRLSEADNNIMKLEADIRVLNSRLNSIRDALAAENGISIQNLPFLTSAELTARQSQAITGINTSSSAEHSTNFELISMEISRARTAFLNAQLSFELGTISRNDFINADNTYKALIVKYEAEIEDLRLTVLSRQIDLANLRLNRESIAEALRDFRNNTVVRAPADGIILDLHAERGKFLPENTLLVSIGVGREFVVECNISLENNFVNPGDTCELSNSSHVIIGTVRRVRPSANGKTVTISLISDNVSDGESFTIAFEKNSASSFTIVPNRAINQDNDGYFLYQIKRRRGIMGQEYYIDRLNIFIGDSDHQNTAVIRGITFFEPIVLVGDKSLQAGMTVNLRNADDFFEN